MKDRWGSIICVVLAILNFVAFAFFGSMVNLFAGLFITMCAVFCYIMESNTKRYRKRIWGDW